MRRQLGLEPDGGRPHRRGKQRDSFVQKMRREVGRQVRDVERRADLDEIDADEVAAGQAAHQLQRLARRQAARHRRARARRERGIDAVDVEGQVDGALADDLAHLGEHVGDAALADLVGADGGGAELRHQVAVFGGAPGSAHAELHQRAGGDEALFDGVAQRRAVMPGVAPDLGGRGVVVRVDVHHRQRAVRGGDRAHRRQRHRVIAADDEGRRAGGDDARHLGLHRRAHRGGVEGREDHVAAVAHADAREHVGAMDRVVALDQRAHAPDVIGPEARARLIGGAAVEGHAEQDRVGAGVGVGRGHVDDGEPEERGLPVPQVVRRALLAHRGTLPAHPAQEDRSARPTGPPLTFARRRSLTSTRPHERTRHSICRTAERARCARSSGLWKSAGAMTRPMRTWTNDDGRIAVRR